MKQYIDNSIDTDLKKTETLNWLPFIGKDYFLNEQKILIIGESHYVPIGENPEFYLRDTWTREFILKEGLQIKPLYTSEIKNNLIREVEKTIVGEKNSAFWNSVAYFNLIQRLLPTIKGQDRPKYIDFVEGLRNLKIVIPLLKPDWILFCGVESSKHFKNVLNDDEFNINELNIPDYKINGCYPKSFTLETNNRTVNCYFVKHPSKAYSYEKWRDFIFQK